MTTEGWKSRNPETSMQLMDEEVTLLEEGDILVTENGYEEIKNLIGMCAPADTQLYNFKVSGDHTYYANGYLVHNKAVCPEEDVSGVPDCPRTTVDVTSNLTRYTFTLPDGYDGDTVSQPPKTTSFGSTQVFYNATCHKGQGWCQCGGLTNARNLNSCACAYAGP